MKAIKPSRSVRPKTLLVLLNSVSEAIREQGTAHLAAAGNPTAMTSLDQ